MRIKITVTPWEGQAYTKKVKSENEATLFINKMSNDDEIKSTVRQGAK